MYVYTPCEVLHNIVNNNNLAAASYSSTLAAATILKWRAPILIWRLTPLGHHNTNYGLLIRHVLSTLRR